MGCIAIGGFVVTSGNGNAGRGGIAIGPVSEANGANGHKGGFAKGTGSQANGGGVALNGGDINRGGVALNGGDTPPGSNIAIGPHVSTGLDERDNLVICFHVQMLNGIGKCGSGGRQIGFELG